MSWLYSIVFASLLASSGGELAKPAHSFQNTPPVQADTRALRDETEVFEQSYPLNADGRVSVSNVNGSIVVEAWDRNEVKLTATKVADTREALQEVEIRVDARPEHFNVEADYDEMKWRNRSDNNNRYRRLEVQFKLSVPRTAALNEVETVNGSVTVANFVNSTRISAVNGNVSATNLRGAAELSTVNGSVLADFDRLESGTKIDLNTVNGRVNLTIPSDANATLRADSLNGSITNEFGLPVRKGEYVGRDLHGRIGSGDVQIKLNSVNGGLAINRKKDGRSPNPATNLLPATRRDSDAPDNDMSGPAIDTARINREIARAMRDANRETAKANKEARKATEKLKDLKIEMDVDLKDMEVTINESVNESLKVKNRELVSMRNAMWLGGGTSIERKTNSFTIKGTPKVVINAEESDVRVRGWDRPEVKYVLTEMSGPRDRDKAIVQEEQSAAGVNLKVINKSAGHGGRPASGREVRLEVFVPRKSNLKIISDGEIRLEGVSGEIDLDGGDEPIDVRGSGGKLNLINDDGVARVIGFTGELIAKTQDGEVYLDGDFNKIQADAVDGKFVLTLPENADAEVHAPSGQVDVSEMTGVKKDSENILKLGKGSRKYTFRLTDGSVVLQNRDSVAGI